MRRLLIAALLGASLSAHAQEEPAMPKERTADELMALRVSDFDTTMTTALGEAQLRELELSELRRKLALPEGELAVKELPGAMWTTLLFNTEKEKAREVVLAQLPTLATRPVNFQQYFLYAAYNLYAKESVPHFRALLTAEGVADREFAIAAYGLLKGTAGAAEEAAAREAIHEAAIKRQIPGGGYAPRIEALLQEVATPRAAAVRERPPLVDLLSAPYKPGHPVIFSFQRVQRTHPGLAVVRGPNNRFIRNADGSLFNVGQLANARTDLPGTITNGNTPQGLFVITGTGTAQNKWIGPTPYLYSKVPFEATTSEFTQGAKDGDWTPEIYLGMLPESWRSYTPFQEAWLAGKAGRSEMLCHGTTINPEYYRGESYYPFTPSAGCLVTQEYWSKESGELVHSDQLSLVHAFAGEGITTGYLVVVDLDDQKTRVSMGEVIDEIVAAEGRMAE